MTGEDIGQHIERIFEPPVDVLLDPSLLASSNSLERLSGSKIFEAQTQATLDRVPTKPRLGNVYAPASFCRLIEGDGQLDARKTEMWEFYRGQATGSLREEMIELIENNGIRRYEDESALRSSINWEDNVGRVDGQRQLSQILAQELAFLDEGGILMSRTPASLDTIRDAGVPTIDLGRTDLRPEIDRILENLGYGSPATYCAFGLSSVDGTIESLVGDLLSPEAQILLYRLAR